MVNATPQPGYPRERTQFQFCRRQLQPWSRSGRMRNILHQPEFELQTVQPISSRSRYPGPYCCRLLTQYYTPDFTYELHFDNSTFNTDILRASYIEGSSRRKVNILGCDWIGHCEKKVHTSSECLQIQSCLIVKHKALCVVTKKYKSLILILIR